MIASKMQKTFLAVLCIIEWFSLILQLDLQIKNSDVSVSELLIRYFSYFTILSNILVALCVSCLLFNSKNIITKQTSQTAIAVYIFVVGLIYNVILRSIWKPQGLQKLVNELLHVVNPILYFLYWIVFANTIKLKTKNIIYWLIYPFVYTVAVLIRGSFSQFYPYPFLEINKLGLDKVLVNCCGITVLFIITSIIFLTVGNFIASKKSNV